MSTKLRLVVRMRGRVYHGGPALELARELLLTVNLRLTRNLKEILGAFKLLPNPKPFDIAVIREPRIPKNSLYWAIATAPKQRFAPIPEPPLANWDMGVQERVQEMLRTQQEAQVAEAPQPTFRVVPGGNLTQAQAANNFLGQPPRMPRIRNRRAHQ